MTEHDEWQHLGAAADVMSKFAQRPESIVHRPQPVDLPAVLLGARQCNASGSTWEHRVAADLKIKPVGFLEAAFLEALQASIPAPGTPLPLSLPQLPTTSINR